jgi:hypothetical protein
MLPHLSGTATSLPPRRTGHVLVENLQQRISATPVTPSGTAVDNALEALQVSTPIQPRALNLAAVIVNRSHYDHFRNLHIQAPRLIGGVAGWCALLLDFHGGARRDLSGHRGGGLHPDQGDGTAAPTPARLAPRSARADNGLTSAQPEVAGFCSQNWYILRKVSRFSVSNTCQLSRSVIAGSSGKRPQ